MLKVNEKWLRDAEQHHPGIRQTIDYYEALDLPPCPGRGSSDTAAVSAGIVGRSIHVGAATTKMHLLPNGIPEDYYCNACERYFGGPDAAEGAEQDEGSLFLDPRTVTDDDLEAFCRAIQAQGGKDDRVERRSKGGGADGPEATQ
jgi:hypothetical protein